jgi:hypothetical protein
MALTVVSQTCNDAPRGSVTRQLIIQHNKHCNALRATCVLLDADGAVTATDYASILDASGVCLIGDYGTGTEITA